MAMLPSEEPLNICEGEGEGTPEAVRGQKNSRHGTGPFPGLIRKPRSLSCCKVPAMVREIAI